MRPCGLANGIRAGQTAAPPGINRNPAVHVLAVHCKFQRVVPDISLVAQVKPNRQQVHTMQPLDWQRLSGARLSWSGGCVRGQSIKAEGQIAGHRSRVAVEIREHPAAGPIFPGDRRIDKA